MFELTYKGGNSVLITTKNDALWIDPNRESLGIKVEKLKNAVQLATEPRFLVAEEDDKPTFEGPGEYEVGPFAITGFETKHHLSDGAMTATCYRVTVLDDVVVGVIGNVTVDLTDEELETLGLVDVLVVPVGGGGYTLDDIEAAKLVKRIEPKIVIPVHYSGPGLKYEAPQDGIEGFLSQFSGTPTEQLPRLKMKSSSDVPPVLTIYQLERQ